MSSAELSTICAKIESATSSIRISGGSEEDLRFAIERILREHVWDELGVPIPSYEYSTKKRGLSAKHWGRIDALYGLTIFEYKKPNTLKSINEQEDAIQKMDTIYIPGVLGDLRVQIHINGIEKKGHTPLIGGVIWDGNSVIFCEYNCISREFSFSPTFALSNEVLRRIISQVVATFKRKLDPASIAADFGYKSLLIREKLCVRRLYDALIEPSEKTIRLLDEWKKITSQAYSLSETDLRKIAADYGFENTDEIDGIRLFFAIQTYYAIIIKQLAVEVAARFYDSSIGTYLEQIRRAVAKGDLEKEIRNLENGWYYTHFGIRNFLEGGLFSWYLDEWNSDIETVVTNIANVLLSYDVESLVQRPINARDFFKLLYEELVPRKEVRKKLGIYTTPDWLAEMVVDRVIDNLKKPCHESTFLDPGAGTGTFLAILVRKMALSGTANGMKGRALLEKITEQVIGFDIDSLAVLTSRANYLIALASMGLLDQKGDEPIEIPVYFTNSVVRAEEFAKLRLTEAARSLSVARIEAGEKTYDIPLSLMDEILEILNEFKNFIDSNMEFDNVRLVELLSKSDFNKDEIFLLNEIYNTLLNLKRENLDSIWIPILKSHLVSTYFDSFDAVIGNPPWLTYRYLGPGAYKSRVKVLIRDIYSLVEKENLMTHMEMAMLFLSRAIDVYLKPNGVVGFVMPQSIKYADQHHRFRLRETAFDYRIMDFVDCFVTPLFYVPSCFIIIKKTQSTAISMPYTEIRGTLSEKMHKSIPLEVAKEYLSMRKGRLWVNEVGTKSFLSESRLKFRSPRSEYISDVFQGASITPQACWFVDIVDPRGPLVQTSRRAKIRGKKAIEMGVSPIEEKYLFRVVTSAECLPFTSLDFNIAVLPIQLKGSRNYEILNIEKARTLGDTRLVRWLTDATAAWVSSSKKGSMTIYERLDYHGLLTSQNPRAKYAVVYNKSGTHLSSCVIERTKSKDADGRPIMVDYSLYRYSTDNQDEAYFLMAILNSPILDNMIKELQTKGYAGAARDIHKRPFEFPIPLYDKEDIIHQKISELGKEASTKASSILSSILATKGYDIKLEERGTLVPGEVGNLRSSLRRELVNHIEKIDKLTKKVLERLSPKEQQTLNTNQ